MSVSGSNEANALGETGGEVVGGSASRSDATVASRAFWPVSPSVLRSDVRTPEQMKWITDRFKPDGLARLARCDRDYADDHGHYLADVAALALALVGRVEQLQNALREKYETAALTCSRIGGSDEDDPDLGLCDDSRRHPGRAHRCRRGVRGGVRCRVGTHKRRPVMGTVHLPIPWADFHRAGHPPAFAYGQPKVCPLCRVEQAGPKPEDASTPTGGHRSDAD